VVEAAELAVGQDGAVICLTAAVRSPRLSGGHEGDSSSDESPVL
jgi:hypothetical protein